MIEVWAPIAGFEGLYEVSTHGRVRTVDKMQRYLLRNGVEAFRFIPQHALSQQANNRGYTIVHLYRLNKRYARTVHRLVALAYLPNPARLPEVNHKDEDRANPKLDNLEWSTVSDNRKNQRRWRK
jgi:hypothetical protein